MRLLVVTNLYPPQELGGYGRSIADFVWGLQERGHQLQVLTSDAPYLTQSTGDSARVGPSGELVSRQLQLKGSYQDGVQLLEDSAACRSVDQANEAVLSQWMRLGWDGVLVGNLDLLGVELLPVLLEPGVPLLHHVGFVTPPFLSHQCPVVDHYRLVGASHAVLHSLGRSGLPVAQAPVVYPGARIECFGPSATGRGSAVSLALDLLRAGYPIGTAANPLKVGFAGLLMGSKGAHTLVQALIALHQQGVCLQAQLAGASFQLGYREQLQGLLTAAGLDDRVRFVGQLQRPQLSRFWALHQVGVFASTFPEAFGIVGAEVMASGLVLVTTGVGGAAELIEPGVSGLRFEPDNPSSLVSALQTLLVDPQSLLRLSREARQRVQSQFSVSRAAEQLEAEFKSML